MPCTFLVTNMIYWLRMKVVFTCHDILMSNAFTTVSIVCNGICLSIIPDNSEKVTNFIRVFRQNLEMFSILNVMLKFHRFCSFIGNICCIKFLNKALYSVNSYWSSHSMFRLITVQHPKNLHCMNCKWSF